LATGKRWKVVYGIGGWRERVNTVIVKVLKGVVTAKMIEDEFTRILPRLWRWTARKIVDNQFTVRFPNV
jgi:hypothetical protein